MEIHNIIQKAANKTIPKKKEKQEGKVVVWGGFTKSEERKEAKSKGERERYIQLNTEFQRIARIDKKVFNEERIKIEESNRKGKARDLFRKIGAIKGTFNPKIGTIKDRNDRDLVDCRRDQEEMERIHERTIQKKILMNLRTVMVWAVTQSQTFWSVKSSGPYEALLSKKLVDAMEFQ